MVFRPSFDHIGQKKETQRTQNKESIVKRLLGITAALLIGVMGILPTLALAQTPPTPPPPTIIGRVVDTATGIGLASQAYPWTYLQMKYVGIDGSSLYWWTDCSIGQGCADSDGYFNFLGAFPAGKYQLIGYADGYLQTVLGFEFGGIAQDIGNIALTRKPVRVLFDYVTPTIPSSGGVLEFTFRVVDESGDSDVEKYEAHVILSSSGPASWVQFPAKSQPVGALRNGRSRTHSDSLEVPGNLPDGTWVCVNIQVSVLNRPFDGLDATGVCVLKGPYTPGGGKG